MKLQSVDLITRNSLDQEQESAGEHFQNYVRESGSCVPCFWSFARYFQNIFMSFIWPAVSAVCRVLLFVIPLVIGNFPWRPIELLIILTCLTATFAAVQEGHYIRKGIEL